MQKKLNLWKSALCSILVAATFLGFLFGGESSAENGIVKTFQKQTELQTEKLRSVIILNGGEEIDWPCGIPFTDPGYVAYDRKGNNQTEAVIVKGTVTAWQIGEYKLTYLLKDDKGTIAKAIRTVKIVKTELPKTVKQSKKTIYLTFDDGPSKYTKKVLKILDKYNIKATFFIIGNQKRCSELLPRIAAAGHTIGVHSYSHMFDLMYKDKQSFFEDFLHTQEIIYKYTGSYAKVARLPGGGVSASILTAKLPGKYKTFKKMMHNMGIRYYDWDIQPESATRSTEGTIQTFISEMRHRKSATIVLQHDTRYYSVEALESMIVWALDHGYTFLPIDQTTPEIHFEYVFEN